MLNRDNLLGKIRALLSKTMENGCTEEEMLSSLAKARAMQDAYEVSDEELKLTKEEKAKLHPSADNTDPHDIKRFLASAVMIFADVKCYRDGKGIVFVGLPSDTAFAHWLLQHLQAFVQGELAEHLAASQAPKGERRRMINGFVLGCTGRIYQRVKDMCKPPVQQASNSRALVVTKQAAAAQALKDAGINLRKSRATTRKVDSESMAAGRAAGDRASFGRPVGGTGKNLLT